MVALYFYKRANRYKYFCTFCNIVKALFFYILSLKLFNGHIVMV